jgi:hypothetical protein
MQPTTSTSQSSAFKVPCDTCDEKLRNVDPRKLSERQLWFLDAYRKRPEIARAARFAAVHRATVYRWLADAAFDDAFRAASDLYYRQHRARAIAEEVARQRWREEREQARRPMRCYYLARARAAKRR